MVLARTMTAHAEQGCLVAADRMHELIALVMIDACRCHCCYLVCHTLMTMHPMHVNGMLSFDAYSRLCR